MALRPLSEADIAQRLKERKEWQKKDGQIQRVFQFPGFMDSISFVNRVAAHAESVDHHPDILVLYNRVTLSISTHDAKGITQKDFDFARMADEIAAQ